ncbi:hypothetical protein E2C01_093240 [Portunus trituberculatus]|uniref:Uncharacterized protein n=1 Tax=Portunus trituberculatus TaxID=210409 RepID=A0A5B7JSP6_PORTR|nr:hypothetical protein [Portunus trituberculatus]
MTIKKALQEKSAGDTRQAADSEEKRPKDCQCSDPFACSRPCGPEKCDEDSSDTREHVSLTPGSHVFLNQANGRNSRGKKKTRKG